MTIKALVILCFFLGVIANAVFTWVIITIRDIKIKDQLAALNRKSDQLLQENELVSVIKDLRTK